MSSRYTNQLPLNVPIAQLKNLSSKNCILLDFLRLEIIHNIGMWHVGLVHHNNKKEKYWCNSHNTIQFFVCPRPMSSNNPPLTTTIIMTTSNMRWQTYVKALTVPSTNGERNKLSNMSPSNVTLPLNTGHPSKHLTCILNRFHYKNLHNYTYKTFLMSTLLFGLKKRFMIFIVVDVYYYNMF